MLRGTDDDASIGIRLQARNRVVEQTQASGRSVARSNSK
jgi:hypothetical protein